MPLYEYMCDNCGYKFELLRPFGQADAPAQCPRCQQQRTRRLVSNFAALSKNGDGATTSVAGSSSCASCAASSCAGCKR